MDRELHAVTVSINVNKLKAGLMCGLARTDEKKKNDDVCMKIDNIIIILGNMEIAQAETRIFQAFLTNVARPAGSVGYTARMVIEGVVGSIFVLGHISFRRDLVMK